MAPSLTTDQPRSFEKVKSIVLNDEAVAELAAIVDALPFKLLSAEPMLATDEEILEIEGFIDALLPPDYRWFLQTIGKVFVSQAYCVQPNAGEGLRISVIYGGKDPLETFDSQSIGWNSSTFSDLLEPGEIVIAQDLFGDMFTLNVETERFRHIGHTGGACIDLGISGFRSFLNLLKPGPTD